MGPKAPSEQREREGEAPGALLLEGATRAPIIMTYAVIQTGGKQYRVEAGSTIQVESLPGDVGALIELEQVRLVHGDVGLVCGQPLVKGAKVTAEIVRHGRTRSITVFKKKRRKNYRRTRGHRQSFTKLLVTNIATA